MKFGSDSSGNRNLADAATILQDLGLPYHYDPNADLSKVMTSIKRSRKPAIVNTQGHAVTVYGETKGRVVYTDPEDPGYLRAADPSAFGARVTGGAVMPSR